jgi:hypothetical protein
MNEEFKVTMFALLYIMIISAGVMILRMLITLTIFIVKNWSL